MVELNRMDIRNGIEIRPAGSIDGLLGNRYSVSQCRLISAIGSPAQREKGGVGWN